MLFSRQVVGRWTESSRTQTRATSHNRQKFGETADQVRDIYTPHNQGVFHGRCACIPSQAFHAGFSDVDIDMISDGMIMINLIFHGTCGKTSAYLLMLEQFQLYYITLQKNMRNHISMCQLINYRLFTGQFIGLVIEKGSNSGIRLCCNTTINGVSCKSCITRYWGKGGGNKPILGPVQKFKSCWKFCCALWWNDRISGKTKKLLNFARTRSLWQKCSCRKIRRVPKDGIYKPVPRNFFCMDLGKWDYAVILFEEYHQETFQKYIGQMKSLMEGKNVLCRCEMCR